MDITEIMNNATYIAKGIAPVDTGNLKNNAIRGVLIQDGFKIVYDDAVAHYIDFLEHGTKFSAKHVGFINLTTKAAITAYIIGLYHKDSSNNTPDKAIKFAKSLGMGAMDKMTELYNGEEE